MTAPSSTPDDQPFVDTLLGDADAWTHDSIPYESGGAASKISNFLGDCSSYVSSVFAENGISVGGYTGSSHGPTTYQQVNYGQRIGSASSAAAGSSLLAKAQPGDVLFFTVAGEGTNAHEAIYAGNGMMYEDPHTGADVQETAVPNNTSEYVDDIQEFVDPTTGAPLGNGITAAGTDLAGPAGTGDGATVTATLTGATTGGSGSSSSSPLINRSFLTRVGIGIMAVFLLLIALDQISKPGQPASQILLQGGKNVRAKGRQTTNGPGPPVGPAAGSDTSQLAG